MEQHPTGGKAQTGAPSGMTIEQDFHHDAAHASCIMLPVVNVKN